MEDDDQDVNLVVAEAAFVNCSPNTSANAVTELTAMTSHLKYLINLFLLSSHMLTCFMCVHTSDAGEDFCLEDHQIACGVDNNQQE
jgi:hypothetical protein